jgi:hypothetical protein
MSEEPPAWKHQREEMHWEYGKNTCSNSAPELLWWHARFYFNFHHQCGTFTATTAVDTPENWQILTVLQRLPLKTRHVAGSATRASQRIIERELQAYAAYAFTKGYPIACLPSIYPRTNHMFRYAQTSCDLRKKTSFPFPIFPTSIWKFV